MIELTRRRDLDLPDGRRISAASGLQRVGNYLHIVADDELHLASFAVDDLGPGRLLRLFEGALPRDHGQRKKRKPDLESLALLPASAVHPEGALLALGSGARPNRKRGALIRLAGDGAAVGAQALDLTPLFASFDGAFVETNIEGAAISKSRLLLFQRGNAGGNAIVSFDLDTALASVGGEAGILAPVIRTVDLGSIDGVPLAFTDATVLSDGRVVFSAAAENTPNAYDDGPLVGAAVGVIDGDGEVARLELLTPIVKVEGIDADAKGDEIRLTMVTDADDPALAAGLYTASMSPLERGVRRDVSRAFQLRSDP